MYRNFFSLSELPFSISPDPKYLFMSERHREALTHLTYGLGEVGGFALLTGEVGTGKTTISRCLMEQLPDNTQVAFILNPTLSSQELLATLCDQLKIRYRKTDASLKNLTDKISEKLLKNHENEINTLLIIDEAQHLQPEVLEQLRLLTNLETNTKKLLQVILIGQPELQQLLQRRDLRQLAQRITARYHLMPLTKSELAQYIQHRLTVADCARPIFDKAAINKIHQLSNGVPRLTNLLCHSALMLAYNQNDSVVNKKTVMAAAGRALGEDLTSKQSQTRFNSALVTSTVLSVAAFFALAGFWWGQTQLPVKDIVVSTAPAPINAVVDEKVMAETVIEAETAKAQADIDNAPNNQTRSPEKNTITEPLVKHAAVQGKEFNVLTPKEEVNKSEADETLLVSANQTNAANKTNHVIASQSAPSQRPPSQEVTNADVNYQVTKVAGVSNDLLARFQQAIDETETENKISNKYQSNFYGTGESSNQQAGTSDFAFDTNETSSIKPLSQMSEELKNALPSMQFEQHIYTSDGQGWVTVNGRDRYEGDSINDNLLVDKILPQHVILSFKGEKFSLPALSNW